MEDIKRAEELIKRATEDIKYLQQQIKHAEVKIEHEAEELKEMTKHSEMVQHLNEEILMEMQLLNEKIKQVMEMKLWIEKKLSQQREHLEKQIRGMQTTHKWTRIQKRGVQPWNTTQIGVTHEQTLKEHTTLTGNISQQSSIWMGYLGTAHIDEIAHEEHVRSAGSERPQWYKNYMCDEASYVDTRCAESDEDAGQLVSEQSHLLSLSRVYRGMKLGQQDEKKTHERHHIEGIWLQSIHQKRRVPYNPRPLNTETHPSKSITQREEMSRIRVYR